MTNIGEAFCSTWFPHFVSSRYLFNSSRQSWLSLPTKFPFDTHALLRIILTAGQN